MSTTIRPTPSPARSPWAALLVLALVTVSLTGCAGGGSRPDAGGAEGSVLVFARGGDSVGLDPAHVDDGESLKVCNSLYDNLVQFRPGTTEVEPALATSWSATPDGLRWTFTLRQGVTFHDGTPFDSEAVLFSLLRQHEVTHEFHGVGGSYKYWGSMGMSDIIDTIVANGPHEVVFQLKKPEAPFLANLAMDFASIVSPSAATAAGERFSHQPVGTGPFRFSRWEQEQRIVLTANDDYWGGRPEVDTLIFEVVKDKQVRILRFQSGEVHAFDNPGPSELQAVAKMPHAKLAQAPGMNVGYLAMNLDRKPFADTRVRLAINHAINKQRMVDAIYKGTGTVAKNPMPPVLWGYEDGIEDYPHDPAKAKRLLAEAGYPDGFETTLWYMPVARPYMPDGKKVAEALQLDLKEVGITADLLTYDWATYLEKTRNGEHDMALLGWSGDNGDPDNFLYVLLSKQAAEPPANNIAFYRNEQFNTLLERAKTSTVQSERDQLYRQAQRVFHDDPAWVCLAHNIQTVVLHQDVEGFVLYPTTRKDFRSVRLVSASPDAS